MAIEVDSALYPVLAGFVRVEHDTARDRWVLQAPERVLVLDESSKEIVDRLSGKVTVGEIIAGLVAEYDAPQEIIEHDVKAVLGLLAGKKFLELHDEPGVG